MYKVSFRKFDIDGVTIVFRDAGVDVALASPKGGQADPKAPSLIEDALSAGKPVAFVCHAPRILTNVKAPHGAPIAEGRAVTEFTNSEEAAMNLVDVVPYLLEDVLKARNGHLLRPVEKVV